MSQCSPEQYHEAMAGIIARNLMLSIEQPDDQQKTIIQEAAQLAESLAHTTQRIRDQGADQTLMDQYKLARESLYRGLLYLRADACQGSIAFEICADAATCVMQLFQCIRATARA